MTRSIRKLTERILEKKLQDVSGWTLSKTKTQIAKSYDFNSYLDGLAFVARVAVYAEVLQHHPELILSHKKVKVALTTHEAKGLTAKDFDIAKKIDRIAQRA